MLGSKKVLLMFVISLSMASGPGCSAVRYFKNRAKQRQEAARQEQLVNCPDGLVQCSDGIARFCESRYGSRDFVVLRQNPEAGTVVMRCSED